MITDATLSGNPCGDNGREGIDNVGIDSRNNGAGLGPDIAGIGDGGSGSSASFTGKEFGTGGETEASRLDDDGSTEP